MRHLGVRAALIGAVMLCTSSAAHAAELMTPAGRPAGGVWQAWVARSREPVVRGRIQFVPIYGDGTAQCGEPALGCSSTFGGAFIAVDPHDRFTLFHELGELFDDELLTGHERARLLVMMGEPRAPWVNGGAEDDFADLYATCAIGWRTRGWYAGGGYPVVGSLHQLDRVCARIELYGDAVLD